MSGLLVSVRSASEALAALQGGADIIDIKEPHRGALGAADSSCWQEIVSALKAAALPSESRPVSVALGELLELPGDDPLQARSVADFHGITWCKVGLAGCRYESDWQDRWLRLLKQIPTGVKNVAVAYVDWENANSPMPREIIRAAASVSCPAVLFDTYGKTGGDLFDAADFAEIDSLINDVQQSGALAVIGGSLQLKSVPSALALDADYLAVRTAVCHQKQRSGEVTSAAVADFLSQMRATTKLENRTS